VSRILVIKLGALGDFIQALGPAAAIRRHHIGADISLLTTKIYAEFAASCPYFDWIHIDRRPSLADVPALISLRRWLRAGRFDRVYDLQTSDRSSWYHALMGPGRRPEWSGIARGSSHPHANPARDRMHTIDRQRDQLAMAGIGDVPLPDLGWARADIGRFALPERYAILVAGASAHRPAKRWPVEHYAALADRLSGNGIKPLLVGGKDEQVLAPMIPAALDLTAQTSLLELAEIGRGAAVAVGNDTGPMHLLAAVGTPSTVLFSADSDPALTAPRGAAVTILRRDSLADLSVGEVAATLPLG
jgi:ADP-heptose:LPS heptosyltransferase